MKTIQTVRQSVAVDPSVSIDSIRGSKWNIWSRSWICIGKGLSIGVSINRGLSGRGVTVREEVLRNILQVFKGRIRDERDVFLHNSLDSFQIKTK